MQDTSDQTDRSGAESALDTHQGPERSPVAPDSTGSDDALEDRIRPATPDEAMTEDDREESADRITELETEIRQLEAEISTLEGIIERKDEQLQQIISNYENIIEHKHRETETEESTIDVLHSRLPSGAHRVFGWFR